MMSSVAVSEIQKGTITEEKRNYNLWFYSDDWCINCVGENNKLQVDEQTRTIRCPKCGYTQVFEETAWKSRQANRYVIYKYMPGQYFFKNLSMEEILRVFTDR